MARGAGLDRARAVEVLNELMQLEHGPGPVHPARAAGAGPGAAGVGPLVPGRGRGASSTPA